MSCAVAAHTNLGGSPPRRSERDARLYGTSASNSVDDAPGTDRSQPSAWARRGAEQGERRAAMEARARLRSAAGNVQDHLRGAGVDLLHGGAHVGLHGESFARDKAQRACSATRNKEGQVRHGSEHELLTACKGQKKSLTSQKKGKMKSAGY